MHQYLLRQEQSFSRGYSRKGLNARHQYYLFCVFIAVQKYNTFTLFLRYIVKFMPEKTSISGLVRKMLSVHLVFSKPDQFSNNAPVVASFSDFSGYFAVSPHRNFTYVGVNIAGWSASVSLANYLREQCKLVHVLLLITLSQRRPAYISTGAPFHSIIC